MWRALMRVMVALPKMLDDDLQSETGLSLSEYIVLMHLSEAPDSEMRMTDLALAATLSVSRTSRIVDSLAARGWVAKRRDAKDARGSVATLTIKGLRRLEAAYPTLLASARKRVVDHVDPASIPAVADQLHSVAASLD